MGHDQCVVQSLPFGIYPVDCRLCGRAGKDGSPPVGRPLFCPFYGWTFSYNRINRYYLCATWQNARRCGELLADIDWHHFDMGCLGNAWGREMLNVREPFV